jgi:phospholipid/cholesterol/gamma-HCH transport system substrate-binding protein
MAMNTTRERTLVGLFVLAAGVLFFGTMLAISGGLGTSTVFHRTYFKFAGGVQPGAPVRYGGLTVGKVERVQVDAGNTSRIEIDFAVDKAAPLKTDSVAKISALTPLTDNYIEISTGTERAPLAPPGSTLLSAEAFGLPQLGDAAQALVPDVQLAIRKLNQNLDGLQVTLARANDLLNDRNRASIGQSLQQVQRLVTDAGPKVNGTLDNLNGMLDDSRPKVAQTLRNVQDATGTLTPLLDDVKTATGRANETLGHLDATLVENRPEIRKSIASLRDTLGKSAALLDQINQTLDQNSPNIDELLDNLRMSTENLRSLTETLKRSPASLIRGISAPDRKPGDIQK